MLPNVEIWKNDALKKLDEKSKQYDAADKAALKIDFLQRAILLVAPRIEYNGDLDKFYQLFDACIEMIPVNKDVKLATHNAYLRQISNLQKEMKAKYNLVPRHYFKRLWVPLGIAIGAGWGVALKNIALGLGIGILFGMLIGLGFDRKAKKENRVI